MRREAKRLVDMRMQLAHHAHGGLPGQHTRHTARMPLGGHLGRGGLIQRQIGAQPVRDPAHRLHGVAPVHGAAFAQPAGLHRIAGQDARHMHRLCGQAGVERRQLLVGGAHAARQRRNRRGLRIPQVHVADLIQRHVLQTAAQIQTYGLRQRRQDIAAQERTVAGQRIGDLHAHALDLIGVIGERAVILIAHERIGQGLHQTVFRQLVGHLALAALIVGQADLALHGGRGHGHRNLVISDQSGDLLDQIARLVQIGAPARRHDRELAVAAAGHTAADIGQDLADPVHIGVQPRHARDLGGLEMNRATTRHIVHVGRMLGGLAVAVADQQLGGHLRGGGLQLRVHAAFETAGGLGRGLVAAGGARDRHLVEVRGL